MASLNAVRALLGLPPAEEGAPLTSLNEALAGCPEPAAWEVVRAAGQVAALELRAELALPLLLEVLRDAAMSSRPEAALVQLLSTWTGGFAEIRSSWGDIVAAQGRRVSETLTQRLTHRERHVGSLSLAIPPQWAYLIPVATEYALLARLQSAAAGAARRRVGERVLEAFLSGSDDLHSLGWEPFAVAVASFSARLGDVAAREDALDVLAAVGEGYLSERKLRGYSTVRGGQAVWLWSTLNLPAEGRELHEALTRSTAQDVRVGVSARHVLHSRGASGEVREAYAEAQQALAATRSKRAYTSFSGMDALYALRASGSLDALHKQVRAQLAALPADGKVEETLRAYLSHAGTLPELAKEQGIHLNTLRYRLRRAEEALGAKLSDPALLARLYLAFGAQADFQELGTRHVTSKEGRAT